MAKKEQKPQTTKTQGHITTRLTHTDGGKHKIYVVYTDDIPKDDAAFVVECDKTVVYCSEKNTTDSIAEKWSVVLEEDGKEYKLPAHRRANQIVFVRKVKEDNETIV